MVVSLVAAMVAHRWSGAGPRLPSAPAPPGADGRGLTLVPSPAEPSPTGDDPAEGGDERAGPPGATVRLPCEGPLAVEPLRRFLAAHVVPGLERRDPATGTHTRAVPHAGRWTVVDVTVADDGVVTARAGGTSGAEAGPGHGVGPGAEPARADGAAWAAPVRRWLGLDHDAVAADAALADDPLIGPMVAVRPGMRVPGTVDGAETAVMAVIGQQVSLAAACTFAGRLVAAHGEPADDGLRLFPRADVLVDAGAAAIKSATGLTTARSATVAALAQVLAGGLDLSTGQDADARAVVRRDLLAVPGIGPWTADYVALRALGDPDAFLPGDLVAKRALGAATARAAEAAAQGWRPWRAHALLHLWTAAVFV